MKKKKNKHPQYIQMYMKYDILCFKIDYYINSSGLVEGAKGAVKSGMGNYLDF
jgi:hypothetical protein